MRSPWVALFAALLNVNFGLSALRSRIRQRERLWELALVGLGIALVAALVLFVVWILVDVMVAQAYQLGQPEVVLTLAHSAAAVVVFVFGIPFMMGAFFFSNDAQLLTSWPLRPRSVVAAKFATVLVNEYITLTFFLVPAYVLYARHVPVGAWYVPAAVATYLLTPVVPLALAAFVSLALMRTASGTNKREHFAVAGAAIVVAAALAAQYFLQHFLEVAPESTNEFNRFVLERAHGLSEYVSAGYPIAFWSMLVLAKAGSLQSFTALAGVFAAGVAASAAMILAGERMFLRAAQESGVQRRGRTGLGGLAKASPAAWSIARAEFTVFLRSPMYVFNSIGALLLLSALIIFPAFAANERLEMVFGLGRANPHVALAVLWAWFPLASGLSVIPSTAVSREGARLWVLKSLPVSGREYFLGKLLGAQSLILLAALPGALGFAYMMQAPLGTFALGVLLGALSSFFVSALCLALDMARPWLTWTDPTRAVKSNPNGFAGSIGAAAAVTLGAFGAIRLSALGLAAGAVIAIVMLAIAAAALVLWLVISPRLQQLLQRAGE